MGPYSHIVIASKLEADIQPEDVQEYYWGAVAPDIRYLVAGMWRNQTHLPTEKILVYMFCYPELRAFLQGYLVHCLSDSLDLPQIIQQKFPFNLQKKSLSVQHCSVILEFFNIERNKPFRETLSGRFNLFLSELGISSEHVANFVQAIRRYTYNPSFEASVALYQNLGLAGDDRIEKYRVAVERFQRKWLQRKLILFGLQAGNVNQEITALVKSTLPDT